MRRVLPVYWPLKSVMLTFKKGIMVKYKCGFRQSSCCLWVCCTQHNLWLFLIGAVQIEWYFGLSTDALSMNFHSTFRSVGVDGEHSLTISDTYWWGTTKAKYKNEKAKHKSQGCSRLYFGGWGLLQVQFHSWRSPEYQFVNMCLLLLTS